jgi:transposase-like protein
MSTNQKNFKSNPRDRRYRRFSEAFKRKRVQEVEEGRATVGEISQAYEVSDTSVYKWLEKYTRREKPERTIVESKSDTTKIIALEKRIAELERLVGQKQIEIEFKDKMIELAEKEYRIDIKKKLNEKR